MDQVEQRGAQRRGMLGLFLREMAYLRKVMSRFASDSSTLWWISVIISTIPILHRGHAVAQLVEALRYKPEVRGFDSWCCHWNFSLTWSFWLHYGPGVDSASNRNEYQECFLSGKGGRCVGLTTLPPLCANCLEIREPQPPGTLRACPGL